MGNCAGNKHKDIENYGREFFFERDVNEESKISINEIEKTLITVDGNTPSSCNSREREKDRSDPDYDRSYGRAKMFFPGIWGYGGIRTFESIAMEKLFTK
ncbi:hypothetical protein IFM89_006950 [Coptis chinensis]|uniref:Uncharacterized protein n=1 Tax=Coptis chinensis TaxID=261450 RepID=A0A835HFQ6_9MAGN|nr:hypothetical protein IFM89_006950 [Coptis chinensis]